MPAFSLGTFTDHGRTFPGLVVEDRVHDLTGHFPGRTLRDLLDSWADVAVPEWGVKDGDWGWSSPDYITQMRTAFEAAAGSPTRRKPRSTSSCSESPTSRGTEIREEPR